MPANDNNDKKGATSPLVVASSEHSFQIDAEAMRALLRSQLEEELALFYKPSLLNHFQTSDETIDQLVHFWINNPNCEFWIAVEQGRYAGFLCAQVRADIFNDKDIVSGEIVAVFVEPDWRKRGLATKLLNLSEAWMVSQNAKVLNVSWLKGNHASESLYKGFGVEDLMSSGRKLL